MPESARTLGIRGTARASLGDAGGLAEMERALALLVEQGAGQQAATLQNNLAIARYPLEGPAGSLAAFERGIAFCERRGLAGLARWQEADCPGLLVELGRPDEALERAGRLGAVLEETGASHLLLWVRALELAVDIARGEPQAAHARADWVVEGVRASGLTDVTVEGLAAAASAQLAAGAHERARELLAELEKTPGAREAPYYSRHLARMVRTALAADGPELAKQLAGGLEPLYPLHEHALRACRAQLAEAAGEQAEAAKLYGEASENWRAFGNIPERAYALLGRGRCLTAVGEPEAEQPLREARELFALVGYTPALAETEALLGESEAAAV